VELGAFYTSYSLQGRFLPNTWFTLSVLVLTHIADQSYHWSPIFDKISYVKRRVERETPLLGGAASGAEAEHFFWPRLRCDFKGNVQRIYEDAEVLREPARRTPIVEPSVDWRIATRGHEMVGYSMLRFMPGAAPFQGSEHTVYMLIGPFGTSGEGPYSWTKDSTHGGLNKCKE
jgi:hypothetical protein